MLFVIDEPEIIRTMELTGLDRMQAWRNIQQRQHLAAAADERRRAALDAALRSFVKTDPPKV